MSYRLGIDLGVNSLGWCAVEIDRSGDPKRIVDIGVRIFTDGRDPKTGTSLAADRRLARQMRRRRDRYLRRRKNLMEALAGIGLMPADARERKTLETLDPYKLRAHGLSEKLTPHEFGRALFHLNQRRGFKSSRKNVSDEKKEAGLIDSAVADLKGAMAEADARTIGEYLWKRHSQRQSVRVRLQGAGKDAHYEYYPQRALLEDEFEKLWAKQAGYHPGLLTDPAKANLKNIIFYQRPLKPVVPGRCTLDPSERRAPWALPLAQRFRIYQELANLRIERFGTSEYLTRAQRDAVFAKLERKANKLTFDQIRRALKLDSTHRFNLESSTRAGLKGDETGTRLAKKKLFGKAWWELSAERQNQIAEIILATDDDEKLAEIARRDWALADDNAKAVARVALRDGYASIGRTAMSMIVPIMVEQGLDYHHAAKEAGYEPSDFRGDGSMDALPYYGEILNRAVVGDSGDPNDPPEKQFGRFPNPTVHIALNQVRAVVNALIARRGKPREIVVELARELKQNKEQKDAHKKRITDDTARNEQIAEKLATLGVENNALNRKTYKLWEELGSPEDRRCIYTDKPIPASKIFSADVAIDHILPFSRTLDDGMDNLLLCSATANRAKTNLTPHEWKGSSPEWDDILLRADKLPQRKRRRFHADAMEWWLREEADFIARHLTDTQWIARAAKEYLGGICPADRVWATPGRLTHLLRGKWGLNTILQDLRRGTRTNDPAAGDDNASLPGVTKNRNDHRHHAIDAFVIALTERGILNRAARAAGQSSPDRIIDDMPEPWPGFRDDLHRHIGNVLVALKSDRSKQGRLHEDTAYGLIAHPEDWGGHNVVYRKAFAELNENEISRIRDPDLRGQVQKHIAETKAGGSIAGVALKAALASFRDRKGVTPRRVRLTKREAPLIHVRDRRDGTFYKALTPGENWCIDIFEQPDGTWSGAPVTVFQANQQTALDEKRKGHPAARRILRVHKGDYLKLEHEGGERIFRVVRLRAKARQLMLAEHNEAGNLADRHKDSADPFRWLSASYNELRRRHARKVSVDVLGRVRDPGPPK